MALDYAVLCVIIQSRGTETNPSPVNWPAQTAQPWKVLACVMALLPAQCEMSLTGSCVWTVSPSLMALGRDGDELWGLVAMRPRQHLGNHWWQAFPLRVINYSTAGHWNIKNPSRTFSLPRAPPCLPHLDGLNLLKISQDKSSESKAVLTKHVSQRQGEQPIQVPRSALGELGSWVSAGSSLHLYSPL